VNKQGERCSTCREQVRNAYRFLSKKLKEKDHLGDRNKWKDTVKKKRKLQK
jgi:ferredoxin